MDILQNPEFLRILDAKLVSNPPFVESNVLTALRDMRLAAPTLAAIPELAKPFSDLCSELKYAYIESLEMSLEDFESMSPDDCKRGISDFILGSRAILEDWVFSEIYDPMLSDTRAYFDGGLAAAIFQDMLLVNEMAGIEADIDEDSRRDFMTSAIGVSNRILDAQADNSFTPPGLTKLSDPQFRQYIRDMTVFPKFRHEQLSESDVTTAAYSMMFDDATAFVRSELEDALIKSEQQTTHKRIAIGVASVAALGAAYLAWRLYTCRKQAPAEIEPDIDLDRPWELQWTYTDLPAGKP